MITLYTFPGTGELESVSPFCMKVECYLKLQKVPYETRAGDPRKAPKGKMPFIAVGDATIADSSVIVDFLEQKSDRPLDHGLSVAGRAQAHLLKRTIEESLYFAMLWSRWADDDGWIELGPRIASFVPAPVRWFVPRLLRRNVVASLVAQGIGRHGREEIYELGKADIAAITGALGDRDYLVDDQLRTIDVTAYAFLAHLMFWPRPSPLTTAARSVPALEAYVRRIGALLKAPAAAATA